MVLRVLFLATVCLAARSNFESGNGISDFEHSIEGHNKQVVCYWGTWANYRPDNGKFVPEDIDGSLCTNLIYSFAGLDAETWAIKSLDPWMDLVDDNALAGFKKATDLKYAYPHLKVTLAIGGWNEGSKKYSEMARDPEKRKIFALSVVSFLQEHNFDGLDLDWEYPAKRGGIAEDKSNFIELIRDLKDVFKPHNFLLTTAIGAPAPTIDISYDVPAMYELLDFVHVMCYDYHGKWDQKTGHNAPLYPRPDEKGQDTFLNIKYTIDYLMKKGAIAEKTVLGVPLYGRAFMLKNPHDHGMGAKTRTTSFQGPYTREDGFLGYNEICEKQLDENDWTIEWDADHKAPYMHKGIQWVSYDDQESVRVKSEFAYDQGLAGVMTWSIDTDDFRGLCHDGQKFPLLRTINNALYEREQGLSGAGKVNTALGLSVILIAIQRFIL